MTAGRAAVRAWPRLGLAIEDWPGFGRHLEREYGPAVRSEWPMAGEPPVGMVIERLRPRAGSADDQVVRRRRWKTTSWSVGLADPDTAPIRAGLAVRGLFGQSLVQSLVVEPLLTIATARSGRVLLPAAGILVDGRTVLVAGASRSGKSSLAIRAWSHGRQLLGDDRVILEADGSVASFPRRFRLYPDVAETAPDAYRRLGSGVRLALRRAHALRVVTRGWVALPVLVRSQDIVGAGVAVAPVGRLVVIERAADERTVRWVPGLAAAIDRLDAVLVRDLAAVTDHDRRWSEETERVRARIGTMVARGVETAGASAGVLLVPDGWSAARAIEAIERELGTGS
jgi:hypothetical protein